MITENNFITNPSNIFDKEPKKVTAVMKTVAARPVPLPGKDYDSAYE